MLARIASRQCASGDPDAAVTLRSAQTAVHAVEQKWLVDAAEGLTYALTACESAVDAPAVVQELAPSGVDDVLERVAQQLTEHRDYAHAAQIDRRLPREPGPSSSLLSHDGRSHVIRFPKPERIATASARFAVRPFLRSTR